MSVLESRKRRIEERWLTKETTGRKGLSQRLWGKEEKDFNGRCQACSPQTPSVEGDCIFPTKLKVHTLSISQSALCIVQEILCYINHWGAFNWSGASFPFISILHSSCSSLTHKIGGWGYCFTQNSHMECVTTTSILSSGKIRKNCFKARRLWTGKSRGLDKFLNHFLFYLQDRALRDNQLSWKAWQS